MPDRAVVDDVPCAWCGGDGYVTGSMACPECTPKTRTVVAISEDRQWLVVRCREGTGYGLMFAVLMCRGGDYEVFDHIRDTGQGAEEVLREWMEGRE